MEEGYKFNEFHCASHTTQPVRISSNTSTVLHSSGSFYKKNPSEAPVVVRRSEFAKGKGGSMYSSSKCMKGVTPNLNSKGKIVEKTTFLFHNPEEQGSSDGGSQGTASEEIKELKGIQAMPQLSKQPSVDIVKSRSTTDSDGSKVESQPNCSAPLMQDNSLAFPVSEEDLKEKLAHVLSPSPFNKEDPGTHEATLDQYVASSEGSSKNFLFSQFYGSELMGSNPKAWKRALKDHIVHTLESICIIKKLDGVPNSIIEKKKVTLNPKPACKIYHLLRDSKENYCLRSRRDFGTLCAARHRKN
jgi:hypothetical protein